MRHSQIQRPAPERFERLALALRVPLPTGTATLLLTDIEDSTQHWEQQRAAMPAVNRVARLLTMAHGGQVVASNATA